MLVSAFSLFTSFLFLLFLLVCSFSLCTFPCVCSFSYLCLSRTTFGERSERLATPPAQSSHDHCWNLVKELAGTDMGERNGPVKKTDHRSTLMGTQKHGGSTLSSAKACPKNILRSNACALARQISLVARTQANILSLRSTGMSTMNVTFERKSDANYRSARRVASSFSGRPADPPSKIGFTPHHEQKKALDVMDAPT